MHPGIIVAIVVGVLLLAILVFLFVRSVRIVKQETAVIVQRFGKYHRTLDTGLKWVNPLFDRSLPPISLKEQVADFKPSEVITKDNVKMMIDDVVFWQVIDPKLFTYAIERPLQAIENITATTLRNIIGEMDLDDTLTSREYVNNKMHKIIDAACDSWGIKIHRVEVRNIIPPPVIQDSMEKQMRAERERRQAILLAEGEKRANILVAEGEKEAAILRAEATKIALLTEAEGQAEAIKKIMEAKPDAAYLTIQGFEALKQVADGQATTIIVPSELQNVATMFTTMQHMLNIGPNAKPVAATKATATPTPPKPPSSSGQNSRK
ncbi:MAG: SPFH/Band 7/PHB domain protein [Firmicutes bacterium]|nr:SPFH/Band 7/PHB domain protein [Bacillota bacterium]